MKSKVSRKWSVSLTAGCSISEVIIWFPLPLNFKAIPLIAKLSDSDPPLVNIISLGSALIASATLCLASSKPFLASRPTEYKVDGFP